MYYGPLDLSSYLGSRSQNTSWSHDMICRIGNTKIYTIDITKRCTPPGASVCVIVASSSVLRWCNMVDPSAWPFQGWDRISATRVYTQWILLPVASAQLLCQSTVCMCASAPLLWQSETLLSLYVSGELHYGNLHSMIALSVQETFQTLDMRLCATARIIFSTEVDCDTHMQRGAPQKLGDGLSHSLSF